MDDILIERCRGWQIASARGVSGWVSWGKMGPITGTSPLDEPGEHVWFQLGATRAEAVEGLKRELGLSGHD